MMSRVPIRNIIRILMVITDMKTQAGRVDVTVTPEEKSTEDGLGHNIEHAVEDGFRVRGDDVAAFADTPGDRVEKPEEDGPDAADGVGPRDVGAEGRCVLTAGHGDGPCDPEEGGAAEDEVAPLRIDQSAR